MNSLKTNAAHVVMATVIITAVVILTWIGKMDPSTTAAIIIGVGGFSMGGGVASSSSGAPALNSASAPVSTTTYSSAVTPATTDSATTPTTTAPTNPSSVL